jgi:hypothetical protein
VKSTALVRLYPRAWRERYGEEFEALMTSHPLGPRMIFDILLGAIDARFSPQPQVAGPAKGAVSGGRVMELLRSGCGTSSTMSRRELWIYAIVTIGATLGVSLLFLWLKRSVGPTPWVEALGATTASIAPAFYLLLIMRDYSLRVRLTFTLGLLGFIYLIGLLAAWI